MIKLPSKKIIWLTVFLVILIIGVLWYLGRQNKLIEDQRLALYRQEILRRQKNLETVVQNSQGDELDQLELNPNWSEIKILTTADNNPETLKTYGRKLVEILAPFANQRENEVKVALLALDTNDPTKIKTLVTARLTYEEAATKLRQIDVPKGSADLHRQLINNLENSALLVGRMEEILTKPIVGLEASRLFLQEETFFYQVIDKINNYFSLNKIDFTEDEKLHLFVNFN